MVTDSNNLTQKEGDYYRVRSDASSVPCVSEWDTYQCPDGLLPAPTFSPEYASQYKVIQTVSVRASPSLDAQVVGTKQAGEIVYGWPQDDGWFNMGIDGWHMKKDGWVMMAQNKDNIFLEPAPESDDDPEELSQPLPEPWELIEDDYYGPPYYYNRLTGETQDEHPVSMDPLKKLAWVPRPIGHDMQLVIAGGKFDNDMQSGLVQVMESETEWYDLPEMPTKLSGGGVFQWQERLYIIAGLKRD